MAGRENWPRRENKSGKGAAYLFADILSGDYYILYFCIAHRSKRYAGKKKKVDISIVRSGKEK
jgi:hypothetical protein